MEPHPGNGEKSPQKLKVNNSFPKWKLWELFLSEPWFIRWLLLSPGASLRLVTFFYFQQQFFCWPQGLLVVIAKSIMIKSWIHYAQMLEITVRQRPSSLAAPFLCSFLGEQKGTKKKREKHLGKQTLPALPSCLHQVNSGKLQAGKYDKKKRKRLLSKPFINFLLCHQATLLPG